MNPFTIKPLDAAIAAREMRSPLLLKQSERRVNSRRNQFQVKSTDRTG